jgi:uncharacterized Zn-binding protein involved in type VI secretion
MTGIYRAACDHDEGAGTSVLKQVPHPFEATPKATQSLVFFNGYPLLLEGDTFQHSGPPHAKPVSGDRLMNPSAATGSGSFIHAGQGLVVLNGRKLATLAGSIATCGEAEPTASCEDTVLLRQPVCVTIAGQPVLPGQPN